MVTCLLIDDEKHALAFLERMLAPYEELVIKGAFTRSEEALSLLEREPVDVVFLDIEMRGKNGLEVADSIGCIHPETEIVFITAHAQFALEAFELGAIDYLLKPLQRKRVDRMIQTLLKRTNYRRGSDSLPGNDRIALQCLYQFHVLLPSGMPAPIRWRTQKTMELFALLLHHRGHLVYRWQLIEILWPDTAPEKASGLLHTSVYYLRKVIKDHMDGIRIGYENEGYRMETGPIDIDAVAWERKLEALPPLDDHTVPQHMEIQQLYPGDYLEVHGFVWAEKESQRLRQLWSEHTLQLAAWLERRERHAESLLCYQAVIARLPYAEEGYWGAMRIRAGRNDASEVNRLYQQLNRTLRQDLGVEPSDGIKAWYRRYGNGAVAAP